MMFSFICVVYSISYKRIPSFLTSNVVVCINKYIQFVHIITQFLQNYGEVVQGKLYTSMIAFPK